MTAKEEILALMARIPDGLTVAETIDHLQSAYAANGSVGKPEQNKTPAAKQPPDGSAPPPLDGQEIKSRIVEIMERLPDDLTAAEAVCEAADNLRLFFLIQKDFEDIREGRMPPFDEQDDEPVFLDEVPEIGAISGDEFERMTMKEKLVHTTKRLPDDLTLGQALIESLERLLLMYKLDRSFEQIRNGQTIPHEEVMRRIAEWREQSASEGEFEEKQQ